MNQEKRGAMRELRKDSAFIEDIRFKEKREKDKELDRKLGQIKSMLQNQEHEVFFLFFCFFVFLFFLFFCFLFFIIFFCFFLNFFLLFYKKMI